MDVADDEVPRAIPCQLWYPAEEDNPYFRSGRAHGAARERNARERIARTGIA